MSMVTLEAGICGFASRISAKRDGDEMVKVSIETDCPHIAKASQELGAVDPMTEIFVKPHETIVYQVFSKHLPHVTCPVYSAILKAVEVEAMLALPKDVSMVVEK